MSTSQISLTGATLHNLKGVDVCIPKGTLTTITGVSGSGKSSLAFDILFEEGRKQYFQLIGMPDYFELEKAYDSLSGLSPTIAIEQRTRALTNPRSTVGTKTGIYALLKQFYMLEGQSKTAFEAKDFTYNDPQGWCPKCRGLGYTLEFHEQKIVKDASLTLFQICAKNAFGYIKNQTHDLAVEFNFPVDTPYRELAAKAKKGFLHGSSSFSGVVPELNKILRKTSSAYRINKIETEFMTKVHCVTCDGQRLKRSALKVTFADRNISQLCRLPLSELTTVLRKNKTRTSEGRALKQAITTRVKNANQAGIAYLDLHRSMNTLSGGEAQRLELASCLNTNLNSLIFILDEPSVGMHAMEVDGLINVLEELRDQGNTIIVVEHEFRIIERSDYVIEMGPRAGVLGGEVVYQGRIEHLQNCQESLTRHYADASFSTERSTVSTAARHLSLRGASLNNLKNCSLNIPLNQLVGIMGVSGCGKSTLLVDTLVPLFEHYQSTGMATCLADKSGEPLGTLTDSGDLERLLVIDQSPIGRVKTSIVASYVGIWDDIRTLFAKQPKAIKRSLTPGHFSFNSKDGACSVCGGAGTVDIDVTFSNHLSIPCNECEGKRFKQDVLEITCRNHSVHDVLAFSVSEAMSFFDEHPSIHRVCEMMQASGLGYLTLGQSVTTLSGGEAQRVKLSKELARRKHTRTLFILDEPTTGLHDADIEKLLSILYGLVDSGGSVIVIEHNTKVLSSCDYLIELGPGGGPKGGCIIAEGTVSAIKDQSKSNTAPYLD